MNNKHAVLYVLGAILLVIVLFFAYKSSRSVVYSPVVTNFEECKNAGYPIMESYPEQCRDAKGNLFVQIINNPNEVPTPSTNAQEFNKPVILKLNQTITFSNNLTVTLKDVDDSRCPADVQCIWAGELSPLFMVLSPTANPAQEVRLGTTNNKSAVVQGYSFVLIDATEDSATIRVSPSNLK